MPEPTPIIDKDLDNLLELLETQPVNIALGSFDLVRLVEQAKEANALREHVETLTDLDKFDVSATKMGVTGSIQGAGAALLASILAKPLFDLNAENYVEQRFSAKDPKTGKRVEFIHTTQKVTGKSPHEKRQEAEAKLKHLATVAAELLDEAERRSAGFPSKWTKAEMWFAFRDHAKSVIEEARG